MKGHTDNLISCPRGMDSQVPSCFCNRSLISKCEKHSTFYLCQPVQLQRLLLPHKPHDTRAPTIPGSLWLIKHNIHFPTCMPLPGMSFPSTFVWLLFIHQIKTQGSLVGPSLIKYSFLCASALLPRVLVPLTCKSFHTMSTDWAPWRTHITFI